MTENNDERLHKPVLNVDTFRWACSECGAFIDALDFEQWNGIRFWEPEKQACPV